MLNPSLIISIHYNTSSFSRWYYLFHLKNSGILDLKFIAAPKIHINVDIKPIFPNKGCQPLNLLKYNWCNIVKNPMIAGSSWYPLTTAFDVDKT